MNIRWLLGALIILLLGGCSFAASVAERGAEPGSDIVIGVGWPLASRNEGLVEGVKLAADEVNASGGVLGRKLVTKSMDDGGSVTEGMAVANRFGADPDVVAVIGHRGSSVSLPASAIYEQSGIVMLTPGSTSPKLTQNGYRYVFRMIPSDDRIGRRMAEYAAAQGYKRVAVVYQDDEYGRGLANAFEDSGKPLGIETLDRVSGYSDLTDLTRLVKEWTTLRCDAVFVAAAMPDGGRTIADLRLAGLRLPLLGGDGLDSAEVPKAAGAAADGTVVASIFNPHDGRPEVADFVAKYKAKYGTEPGKWAGQGYDAVKLLASAIAASGSARPAAIAEALRHTSGWIGVTGIHSFDDSGEAQDNSIVLKKLAGGEFQYLTP